MKAVTRIDEYIQWLDDNQEKVEQELLDVQSGKISIEKLPQEQLKEFKKWLGIQVN